jgi:hypothetical protein
VKPGARSPWNSRARWLADTRQELRAHVEDTWASAAQAEALGDDVLGRWSAAGHPIDVGWIREQLRAGRALAGPLLQGDGILARMTRHLGLPATECLKRAFAHALFLAIEHHLDEQLTAWASEEAFPLAGWTPESLTASDGIRFDLPTELMERIAGPPPRPITEWRGMTVYATPGLAELRTTAALGVLDALGVRAEPGELRRLLVLEAHRGSTAFSDGETGLAVALTSHAEISSVDLHLPLVHSLAYLLRRTIHEERLLPWVSEADCVAHLVDIQSRLSSSLRRQGVEPPRDWQEATRSANARLWSFLRPKDGVPLSALFEGDVSLAAFAAKNDVAALELDAVTPDPGLPEL